MDGATAKALDDSSAVRWRTRWPALTAAWPSAMRVGLACPVVAEPDVAGVAGCNLESALIAHGYRCERIKLSVLIPGAYTLEKPFALRALLPPRSGQTTKNDIRLRVHRPPGQPRQGTPPCQDDLDGTSGVGVVGA